MAQVKLAAKKAECFRMKTPQRCCCAGFIKTNQEENPQKQQEVIRKKEGELGRVRISNLWK